MSKLFNKYGNPIVDGTLAELMQTIEDTTRDIIDEAASQGASVTELRAFECFLNASVSGVFAEDRLRRQIKQRKAERHIEKMWKAMEKKDKPFAYRCPECETEWENKVEPCDCPYCGFRDVSPFIVETSWWDASG